MLQGACARDAHATVTIPEGESSTCKLNLVPPARKFLWAGTAIYWTFSQCQLWQSLVRVGCPFDSVFSFLLSQRDAACELSQHAVHFHTNIGFLRKGQFLIPTVDISRQGSFELALRNLLPSIIGSNNREGVTIFKWPVFATSLMKGLLVLRFRSGWRGQLTRRMAV